MFLESRNITGIKTTNVAIIDINTIFILALKIKKDITNAAAAKAMPTG